MGIAWTTIDINRPAFKILVAALALAEVFTLSALAPLFGFYFSPLLPAAAAIMAFTAGFIYSNSQAGQRQRVVDTAFGPRVSRRQMRALVDGRSELRDDGQLEELTLVVCEIFNHQELMEALEPADFAAVSNRFLNAAAEALVEKGGTLAACDGEGVRVLFGAPLPMANHAGAACRAALEVSRQVRTLNEELAREKDGLTCDLRVGVNSGEMAVGHFGARRLGGFGVAGEEVAFTRRLCAANLIYGSRVLIGARTFELAEATIEARPLELLRRRLGENWLEVYELLGEPHELSPGRPCPARPVLDGRDLLPREAAGRRAGEIYRSPHDRPGGRRPAGFLHHPHQAAPARQGRDGLGDDADPQFDLEHHSIL